MMRPEWNAISSPRGDEVLIRWRERGCSNSNLSTPEEFDTKFPGVLPDCEWWRNGRSIPYREQYQSSTPSPEPAPAAAAKPDPEAFIRRLLDPDDFGLAVSFEVRQAARAVLGLPPAKISLPGAAPERTI